MMKAIFRILKKNQAFFLALFLLPLVSRAQLTISGDTLSISSGAVMSVGTGLQTLSNGSLLPRLQNAGSLYLAGDFDLRDSSDYRGAGKVELTSTGTQDIAGANFSVLRVNGTGTKYLHGNARILDSIKFQGGELNTALYQDTVVLDPAARIEETSTSYLTGWIRTRRTLLRNVTYDFGGMGLNIKATGAAPGLTTVVRGTGDSAIQIGIGNQGVKRVFEISPTRNSGLNASMTFYYRDNELNSYAENMLDLYKSIDSGKTWQYVGYDSRDASANTLSLNGISSFSYWTVGSSIAPLPVELFSFEARLKSPEEALLTWTTASEENNDHFDIERSEDGRTFHKVGEKQGHGTTQMRTDYSYVDRFGHTTASVLFYRLRQVDNNGAFAYSQIRRINLLQQSVSSGIEAAIQPGTGNLLIRLHAASAQTFQLRLVDLHGRVLFEKSINAPQGVSEMSFDMGTLPQSVYHLTATCGTGAYSQRVLRR